jgi:hypothetical protein
MPRKLRGDKRPVRRQFLVDALHTSAVCEGFDPFLVRHFRTSSAKISGVKKLGKSSVWIYRNAQARVQVTGSKAFLLQVH